MKYDQSNKYIAEKEKIQKKGKAYYLKLKSDSDALIATGKIDKFNQKELITILKPSKRGGDKALPSRKKDLIDLYHKWKVCPPIVFDY